MNPICLLFCTNLILDLFVLHRIDLDYVVLDEAYIGLNRFGSLQWFIRCCRTPESVFVNLELDCTSGVNHIIGNLI